MTNLSPAAQAVKDAVLALYSDEKVRKFGWQLDVRTVATALRAAADQMVVSLPQTPSEYDIAQYDGREEAIANLLNIADELEALPE
jgi:hypothetical protein